MRSRALLALLSLAACREPTEPLPAPSPDAAADGSRADAPSLDVNTADGQRVDVPNVEVGACAAIPLGTRTGNVATGTTTGAGSLQGTCGGGGAGEALFTWTAPRAGRWRFDTGGTDFDSVLYVRDGRCEGPELACNDNAPKTDQSVVRVTLGAGDAVVIVLDGFGAGEVGHYALHIREDVARDAGAPDA